GTLFKRRIVEQLGSGEKFLGEFCWHGQIQMNSCITSIILQAGNKIIGDRAEIVRSQLRSTHSRNYVGIYFSILSQYLFVGFVDRIVRCMPPPTAATTTDGFSIRMVLWQHSESA